jgi:hypothetical protein
LLDLAAVGVEDPVVEVGIGLAGRLNLEDLVTADAEMPVGDPSQLIGSQGQGPGQGLQDDEVIAQAMHFSKF